MKKLLITLCLALSSFNLGLAKSIDMENQAKFANTPLKIEITKLNMTKCLEIKPEKIVILLDTSAYMLEESKGGLSGYNQLKEDVKILIGKFPLRHVSFNIVAYDIPDSGDVKINVFSKDCLVESSKDNKEKVYSWLDSINSSLDKLGVENNYTAKLVFMPDMLGANNSENTMLYNAYHAAMEQEADVIYYFTAKCVTPTCDKSPDEAYAKMAKYYAELIQEKNNTPKAVSPILNIVIFKGAKEDVSTLSEFAKKFAFAHKKGKTKIFTAN